MKPISSTAGILLGAVALVTGALFLYARWQYSDGDEVAGPRPPGLVGAPIQRAQEDEENRLLAKVPGHTSDGGKAPLQDTSILAPLPQPFTTLLASMHQFKPQKGTDGKEYPLSLAGVTPQDGIYIYNLCLKVKPQRTLEIGFAEGFSALYFLAAAKTNGAGSHVAVDPFEAQDWHGLGLEKVKEAGMTDRFRLLEEKSVTALPALNAEKLKFDIILIDGDHRYDTQLVDFILSDLVCQKGCYILLHDVWMASTRKLMSFIKANRYDYMQHPSDLDFAIFQKIDEDRRDWRHFVQF